MRECRVVRGGSGAVETRQGLPYFNGVSAESAGASGLCLHVVTLAPGSEARPHLHEGHESAVYVVSGRAGMRYGDGLTEEVRVGPGDFLYIPAGVPHQPFNDGDEPCVAVLARTDPNEQESVVLLD